MKKRIFTILLALSFLPLMAQSKNDAYMSLPTVQGSKIHVKGTENGLEFKEFKGKIVFLEFWGTHCPPCLMSIPHYIDLTKKYGDKFKMVAVEVQDTPKNLLKEFVKARGINYNVVAYRDALPFVRYIAQRAGWNASIPFLMIFDKNGNVVTMQVGLLNEKALAGIIQQLSKAKVKSGNDTNSTKK